MPHKATPDLPITPRARPTRGLPSDPGFGDEGCARDTPRLAPQGGPLDTPIIRTPVFGTKARLTGKTGPSRAAARPGPETKNISCWNANGKTSKITEQTKIRRGIAPVTNKKRRQYYVSWGDPRGAPLPNWPKPTPLPGWSPRTPPRQQHRPRPVPCGGKIMSRERACR